MATGNFLAQRPSFTTLEDDLDSRAANPWIFQQLHYPHQSFDANGANFFIRKLIWTDTPVDHRRSNGERQAELSLQSVLGAIVDQRQRFSRPHLYPNSSDIVR